MPAPVPGQLSLLLALNSGCLFTELHTCECIHHQVVKELKRTVYKPRVVVVGSRQHMCVNPEAMHVNGTARNNYCKQLVKAKECQYHHGIDEMVSTYSSSDFHPLLPVLPVFAA